MIACIIIVISVQNKIPMPGKPGMAIRMVLRNDYLDTYIVNFPSL